MTDESRESIVITPPTGDSSSSPTLPPVSDIDNSPIGRCHPEAVALQQAIGAMDAAMERLRVAMRAMGACRASVNVAGFALRSDSKEIRYLNAIGYAIDGLKQHFADLPADKSDMTEGTAI